MPLVNIPNAGPILKLASKEKQIPIAKIKLNNILWASNHYHNYFQKGAQKRIRYQKLSRHSKNKHVYPSAIIFRI